MRLVELNELDEKEFEKGLKVAKRAVEEFKRNKSGEQLAKYLYPEFPWNGLERAYISPYLLDGWKVIPFYSCPILGISPMTKEEFKNYAGMDVKDVIELSKKGRLYPLLLWLPHSFAGKEFEHLDPLIKMAPGDRSFEVITELVGFDTIQRLEKAGEAINETIISKNALLYSTLCTLGYKRRITMGCRLIRSTNDKTLIRDYERNWLAYLKHQVVIPPYLGAVAPTDEEVGKLINYPLKGNNNSKQEFTSEIAEYLITDLGFVSPANSSELNIDLVIETQNSARDLQRAYQEFAKLVNDLKVKEALETRDALYQIADEFRKSAPFLDKVSSVMYSGISVSAAAVTFAAYQVFFHRG